MCGLCGILGGQEHWSDFLPAANGARPARLRRNERVRRASYLNTVLRAYGCSVSDWQGSKYQVSTFTGKTELVDDLGQLWAAVERLTGRIPDPLSVDVQALLPRGGSNASVEHR